MCSWISGLLAAVAISATSAVAYASSLQVTPVNIEVPAPGAASTVTLNNAGNESINAQIRIFKWVQKDGKDELIPTRDVVASPPAVKLVAGKKSVIRIVRTSKAPSAAEEAYRLVIDEVPKPPKPGSAGVGFAVRHSVPVFFSKSGADIELSWKASVVKGQLVLTASNSGGRRVRLASLRVVNAGKTINVGHGLAGYVLGQSSRIWAVKSGAKSIAPGGTITILAQGDYGPIEATAKVQASN
jgi:fimbrial chaperone protein